MTGMIVAFDARENSITIEPKDSILDKAIYLGQIIDIKKPITSRDENLLALKLGDIAIDSLDKHGRSPVSIGKDIIKELEKMK